MQTDVCCGDFTLHDFSFVNAYSTALVDSHNRSERHSDMMHLFTCGATVPHCCCSVARVAILANIVGVGHEPNVKVGHREKRLNIFINFHFSTDELYDF